ncbi:MED7 protein-domain-containing protein [Syncephalis plumigaleata]|nr:MED7 protein-domain-containing protein [Syncephalis plumigaleata]
MAEQPRLSAAFPPPPPFYEAFTASKLAAYDSWKHSAQATTAGTDAEPATTKQTNLPAEFVQLRPPTPPTTGFYHLFGEQWPVVEEPFSLKDAGITQLYSDAPNVKRADELKRLNHSLVFNFIELVNVLQRCPDQYPTKIDHFRLLLNNFYALINEYRPIQAKETLKLMLQDQIERKQTATRELLAKCQSLTQMIDQVQQHGSSMKATAATTNKQASTSMMDSVMTTIPSSNPIPLSGDIPPPVDTHANIMERQTNNNNDTSNTMIPRQLNDPVLQQKLYDMVMNIS